MSHRGRHSADTALVAMLATGMTHAEAADRAGVAVRTIGRRLQSAEFRARLAQARDEALSRTLGRLAEVSTEAVATLQKLLEADSEMARLGAARTILEQAGKMQETISVTARIQALERAAAAAQHPTLRSVR